MASAGGGTVAPKSNGKEVKVSTPFKDAVGKKPSRTAGE
jgi:hypothetical protein